MKKTFIKLFALVLCLVVAFAAVGCNKDKNDDGEINNELVEVDIFRYDLTSLTTAIRNKTTVASTVVNKFNLDINVKTAPSSNWEETLNTLISTNRIPDMFVCYGPDRPKQYKKWVEQDIILPISDYVSAEKHPNIYNRLQKYDCFLNLDYTNGKHYALPILSGDGDHCLYVRTDWIKAVNTKAKLNGEPTFTEDGTRFNVTGPKTMDEFYWLCKAFAQQDPDGNGKNDTYGFTTNDASLWFLNFAFYAYEKGGFHDRVWDEEKKLWMDTWIADGSKEAVKFFNKLYNEGLMDLEFVNNTGDEKINKFVTGECGIMMHNGVSGYNRILSKFKEVNNGSTEMTYFAPPKGPTGLSGTRGGLGYYCFTAINADVTANQRERLLSLLDYLMSEEGETLMLYGKEGEHFNKDADGKITNLLPKTPEGKQMNITDYDTGTLFYSFVSLNENVIYPWTENAQTLQEIKEMTMANGKLTAPLQYYNGDNILTLGQALDDYSESEYANLIMSASDTFESRWSSFVNTYLTTYSGQKVIDEYNAAVKRYS